MKLKLFLFSTVALMLAFDAGSFAAHTPDPKRGKELFEAMNCSMCHPGGDNVLNPQKALRGSSFRQHFATNAAIVNVIRNGVPGTSMDSFRKDRLSDDQLGDIIAYIRCLPQPDAGKTIGGGGQKNNKTNASLNGSVPSHHSNYTDSQTKMAAGKIAGNSAKTKKKSGAASTFAASID